MTNTDTDYGQIIDILEDILGSSKIHNDYKGQISFDCPVCSHEIKGLDHGDGKGNLEINYRMGVYKCWSCSDTHNTQGGLYRLVKRYGTARHLKLYELLKPEDVGETKRYVKAVRLPLEYVSFNQCTLGVRLTHHYRQATAYLKSRGVNDMMIKKYNIGFAYQGAYAGRIIIPSYNEEEDLNYFIARSYYTKAKLKYKNPEVPKELIIFNEHLIDWESTIYIVEGAFDSIFVPNSIPLLGKVMSELLFKKLYENAKQIVIVLDGDAWSNAEKLYHKLNGGKLFGKIWVVKMPLDKDIADLRGNFEGLEKKQLE